MLNNGYVRPFLTKTKTVPQFLVKFLSLKIHTAASWFLSCYTRRDDELTDILTGSAQGCKREKKNNQLAHSLSTYDCSSTHRLLP